MACGTPRPLTAPTSRQACRLADHLPALDSRSDLPYCSVDTLPSADRSSAIRVHGSTLRPFLSHVTSQGPVEISRGSDTVLSLQRRPISKTHPRHGGQTARSCARLSQVSYTAYRIAVRRPAHMVISDALQV